MRYLPQLLRDLRKYHTGWKITVMDFDGEYYDGCTLTENPTKFETEKFFADVEIEDWETEDNGEDQPEICLYSNIEPEC